MECARDGSRAQTDRQRTEGEEQRQERLHGAFFEAIAGGLPYFGDAHNSVNAIRISRGLDAEQILLLRKAQRLVVVEPARRRNLSLDLGKAPWSGAAPAE